MSSRYLHRRPISLVASLLVMVQNCKILPANVILLRTWQYFLLASSLVCDRYPTPKVEDLFANLSGGRTFTKIDLSQAYQQIPLEEESQKYVVMNTHKDLFKYTCLPFGFSSAPGIFQRVMEGLLQGIPRVVVYLDDILNAGTTDKEHIQALNEVLTHLEKVGLRVKKEKCVLWLNQLKYLEYRIDSDRLHPLKENVSAITEAPAPKNVAD